jgi:four helix bundle protein
MSNVRTHKDLDAWKKAMDLARLVYLVTETFPRHEIHGLTNQMRRAAVSVPSNLAEGAARGSKTEFCRFVRISLGSLAELETQAMLAERIGFLDDARPLLSAIEDIRPLSLGLIRSLEVLKRWGEGYAAELSVADVLENAVVRVCDAFVRGDV